MVKFTGNSYFSWFSKTLGLKKENLTRDESLFKSKYNGIGLAAKELRDVRPLWKKMTKKNVYLTSISPAIMG